MAAVAVDGPRSMKMQEAPGAAARNYSNVHTDIARLIDLGMVERTDGDMIQVPLRQRRASFPARASRLMRQVKRQRSSCLVFID